MLRNPKPADGAAAAIGPSVMDALGMGEEALEDALVWARARTAQLLRSLEDRELLALLDPPGTRSTMAVEAHPASRQSERATLELPTPEHPERATREFEALAGPQRRKRATLELRAVVDESGGDEPLYDMLELDEVELPELEWESPVPAPEPEPDSDELEDTVARVRRRKPAKPHAPTGRDRRVARRYSLVEPAVIEIRSWSELVTLYIKDISCGGMFVQTIAPPQRDTEVTVQLLLPHGAGTLDFDGLVVHVVTAEQAAATGQDSGFGLQFRGLTPERRRALQRLVEQAEAAAASPDAERPRLSELGLTGKPGPAGGLRLTLSEAERRQMQELRTELAAMASRGDLQVLGLSAGSDVDVDVLRSAFERLARRWHPGVAHRDAPPEIRKLATEIFLQIEQAYRRLCEVPRPSAAQASPAPEAVPPPPQYAADGPRPETVIGPAPTAPPTPRHAPSSRSVSRPPSAPRPKAPTPVSTPEGARARQRAKLARRMVGNLVDRGERLTRQLKRRDSATSSASISRKARVDEALQMISGKRYAAAAQQLEQLIVERPEPRLRVLLSVVNARHAIKDRDFARARSCYQAVLQLDPTNALAQRELLMLSAMEGAR